MRISILVMVIIVAVCFSLYGKIYKDRVFDSVTYDCHFNDTEVYQGEEITFIENVSNNKYLPISWLKAEITTSKYLTFSNRCSAITYKSRFVSSCYAIKGNQSIQREWKITASKRGVYSIDSVVLTSCDALGINEISKSIDSIHTSITVLPLEIDSPDIDVAIDKIMGEFQIQNSLFTDPFSMCGVREYTGHERLNRIHWKSSAKQSKLMVIEEEHTSDLNVTIYMYIQDNCEESIAERTLSTVCTIACRLSENGIPVKLDSNCNMKTSTSFGLEHSLNMKRVCAKTEFLPLNYTIPDSSRDSIVVIVSPVKNRNLFKDFDPTRLVLVRL